MTGLPNREALRLRAAVARSRAATIEGTPRAGAPSSWLTVAMDLNLFKEVNDKFGHQQGDRCLLIAGTALRHSTRGEDDEVYHISGDEFAAFLPHRTRTGQPDSEGLVRLQRHVVSRFHINLRTIATGQGAHLLPEGFEMTDTDRACTYFLSGTFGFAASEGPTIDRMEQLAVADLNMLASKDPRAGR